MLIREGQIHISFELELRLGKLPARTVGAPGNQGATVTGMQGTGVGTPSFAAVIAIKRGLLGQLHMPNGGMLAIGILLMMFA